ncbi:hypothetical protein MJ904_27710 [Massilia sp. MB5]|uniref:hypothetical protein n=1 Tax=Massilia sp. MB5 TaxID=2919578 RepID=UPI001F0EDA05|nr:hypothetical protein [Massilia sp. MB5]UMR30690.1 hypothetical protein MJ904_27710 [Massilia sp. MB5]
MKHHSPSLLRLACPVLAGLLSACSYLPFSRPLPPPEPGAIDRPPPLALAADGTPQVQSNGVAIQKVEFRPGVSSATVEHLAGKAACTGGWGAGLVTEPGPVEIYRMACDDGRVFLARCELRQCRAMQK